MEKIIDSEYLNMLETLSLKVRLALKNSQMGSRRSSSKGSSVEFSDYREYMPGDDFRRIDWNAYARFEKVFIKLFMEEQESPITIFLDSSASMSMFDKWSTALKASAAFSYLALAEYDTTSLVMFTDGIKGQLSGLRGKNAFNQLVSTMEKAQTQGESNLYKTVKSRQNQLRKGVTVIVSDFMYNHRLAEVMSLLSFKKQKTILCHVLGEDEIRPIIDENVRLTDIETNQFMNIDAGMAATDIYKQAFERYIKNIEYNCKKYRADYILLDTSQPIEQFIRRLNSMDIR